jgi:hypothetical protein
VTLVTLLLVPDEGPSALTKASSSSLAAVVEKVEVVTEVAAELRSPNTVASMAITAEAMTESVAVCVVPL